MQTSTRTHNTDQKEENVTKSILPGLLTGSLLLSATMAGETGPTTGAVAELAGVKPTAKWEQPPSGQ